MVLSWPPSEMKAMTVKEPVSWHKRAIKRMLTK
ncbi:GpE family phage tail protein [Candidatus Sororendozoicomonas aggregata]